MKEDGWDRAVKDRVGRTGLKAGKDSPADTEGKTKSGTKPEGNLKGKSGRSLKEEQRRT